MTGFMVHASTGDSAADSISRMSIYAVGIALFAITLTINVISGWILRRLPGGLSMSTRGSGTPRVAGQQSAPVSFISGTDGSIRRRLFLSRVFHGPVAS